MVALLVDLTFCQKERYGEGGLEWFWWWDRKELISWVEGVEWFDNGGFMKALGLGDWVRGWN